MKYVRKSHTLTVPLSSIPSQTDPISRFRCHQSIRLDRPLRHTHKNSTSLPDSGGRLRYHYLFLPIRGWIKPSLASVVTPTRVPDRPDATIATAHRPRMAQGAGPRAARDRLTTIESSPEITAPPHVTPHVTSRHSASLHVTAQYIMPG